MNSNNAGVSFGSIHCVSGGQQFLERTLNKAQRKELRRLVESQKNNPINITLAQHTEKRLCGWTVFEENTNVFSFKSKLTFGVFGLQKI